MRYAGKPGPKMVVAIGIKRPGNGGNPSTGGGLNEFMNKAKHGPMQRPKAPPEQSDPTKPGRVPEASAPPSIAGMITQLEELRSTLMPDRESRKTIDGVTMDSDPGQLMTARASDEKVRVLQAALRELNRLRDLMAMEPQGQEGGAGPAQFGG